MPPPKPVPWLDEAADYACSNGACAVALLVLYGCSSPSCCTSSPC
jgi:hypothetical protein